MRFIRTDILSKVKDLLNSEPATGIGALEQTRRHSGDNLLQPLACMCIADQENSMHL